ncbi:hypothetical protein G6Z90_07920 [Vibrio aestuarianus subsp. cardii]|uniref:hypothetical protein n=1 Tax=Vibrio aestuarianus TaxID=28171 RepID=UPI0015941227|nr:hypothetical protein [Vibrio aestuarianus]MDE1309327.1 hypothetical protein [Vibrio aestuarianus]NGZ92421.1 hypothetical protein [Vibrio aestuarianus subsp. cardii]
MEKNVVRDFFSGILKAFPGKDFFPRMYYFIKRPEMLDGEWELSPLKNAGENIVTSLILVVALTSFVNQLLSNSGVISFPLVVNPVYLAINMTIGALIFSSLFWFVLMCLTSVKRKGAYPLYFLQVLQTYSVVNFFVVSLFWIGIQLMITKDFLGLEPSILILTLAGITALTAFYMSYRLLIVPVVNYLSTYYRRWISWFFVIIALSFTLTLNQIISFPVGADSIINKLSLCEYLFKVKSEQDPSLESVKSCLIGKCVAGTNE